MRRTQAHMLSGYLDEFMYRQQYDKKTIEIFNNLLIHISEQYPV